MREGGEGGFIIFFLGGDLFLTFSSPYTHKHSLLCDLAAKTMQGQMSNNLVCYFYCFFLLFFCYCLLNSPLSYFLVSSLTSLPPPLQTLATLISAKRRWAISSTVFLRTIVPLFLLGKSTREGGEWDIFCFVFVFLFFLFFELLTSFFFEY